MNLRGGRPVWSVVVGIVVFMASGAVARGQSVEVTPPSSGVTASTNDGNLPGNTVDNNLTTRWSAEGDGAWIQLALGSRKVVSDVRIAVYNGNTRRNRFDLQVSTDGAAWTNVFTGLETSGTTTAEERFDLPAGTEATHVRYVGHMSNVGTFNSVTEISVFGMSPAVATPTPSPTPTPVPAVINVTPAGAAVTASTNDGNVPANTVDNNLATRWSGCGDGAWIQYDLGATHTVTSMQLAWYSGNTRRTTFDVAVGGSASGPWTALATGLQSSGTTTALETHNVSDGAGRYLRVTGHGNTVNAWNSLSEIEIFASSDATPPSPTPTPTPTTPARVTPTPTPTLAPGAFRHPGVLVNRAQLDLLKARVAAGTQPTLNAYNRAMTDVQGSLSYVPNPWQTVECGPYSTPNLGCSDESRDSRAAYTHALLWAINGNPAHAQKSIEIMNAWSRTLTGGHTNSNAPLQAAWYGSVWPRAAEIIRYTYTGWAQADIDRFKNMLRTQYLPSFINGSCANGNWEASMAEAAINIGVFLDDRAVYDKGVTLWRGRVKAYFYLTSDGSSPLPPSHCSRPSWYGETTYVDGLCQETCRDYGHMSGGFAGLINGAETAYQQGLDLYGEESLRFRKAMEFHTQYLDGVAVPSWLCDGSLDLQVGGTWEIAYNHYNGRKGFSLPHTLAVIQGARPMGSSAHKVWETLSHAGVGSAGLP